MCKTSYVTYLSAHYNFWNVLKYIKKNKIQNTRLLILWTTMAAPSILGNTVWKPFSRSIGPSFPFTIPLLYSFPLQLSPSKKLHNLLYFSFLYEYMTYVYVIFICLVHLLHPTVTQLPGFTIEWNQLWCSINICWMNEFSNFCAFAQTYHWCLTCNESSLRDLPAGGAGEAKSLRSQCKGPGLIPGQGTRSHMPQLRVCMPPPKDPSCSN